VSDDGFAHLSGVQFNHVQALAAFSAMKGNFWSQHISVRPFLENLQHWVFMQTEQSVIKLHEESAKISNLDSKRSEARSFSRKIYANYVYPLRWSRSGESAL
jgi:hypothetical protein